MMPTIFKVSLDLQKKQFNKEIQNECYFLCKKDDDNIDQWENCNDLFSKNIKNKTTNISHCNSSNETNFFTEKYITYEKISRTNFKYVFDADDIY